MDLIYISVSFCQVLWVDHTSSVSAKTHVKLLGWPERYGCMTSLCMRARVGGFVYESAELKVFSHHIIVIAVVIK